MYKSVWHLTNEYDDQKKDMKEFLKIVNNISNENKAVLK